MPSPATCRSAEPDADIAAQKAAIAALDRQLWADGLNETLLPDYQAAWRRLEELIAGGGDDCRHHFVVVIAVADRPQHLEACLASLLQLCRLFGYGGRRSGRYRKVSVLVADDSSDPAHVAGNLDMARRFSEQGLATTCLSPGEQQALLDTLGGTRGDLTRVLGDAPVVTGHKGQAVMRNIAALRLAQLAEEDGPLLFWSVDSDQEFQVKVATPAGDRNVYALSFFHWLDEIFSATDAQVLTGKVVGDPPVSPAVMTANFLADLIGFLERQAEAASGDGPCRHHQAGTQGHGEAAYHDMAELFGFAAAAEAYRYPCALTGQHTDADCLEHFAARLGGFFHGEHPTRVSYYRHGDVEASVQPARTVYVGNTVFRPDALKYFIPFAGLRLRMSGPTLGRLIRAEIGPRFVSANLPMLHKRTVEGTGRAEFRPGIDHRGERIDMTGEFERQFYGDVMLFSVERLAQQGFPRGADAAAIAATLETVRQEMLERYNTRQQVILERLGRLQGLLRDPAHWWNRSGPAAAVAAFAAFADNVARNFGRESTGYRRINATEEWERWRSRMAEAVLRYPQDRQAWERALAALRP